MTSEQLFIARLNCLLECDPTRCKKENCLLYYTEISKCDAIRFLHTFNVKMEQKLESVKTYDPFSEEDIV